MTTEYKPDVDFTADEKRLHDLMSEISEDCWCAGWMHGNEFAIWEAIKTGELRYGMGEMDRELLAQVASLSVKCGRWIVWRDDKTGLDKSKPETWGAYSISLKDWSARNELRATPTSPSTAPTDRSSVTEEMARVCENRAIHWQQEEGTYAAGKKAGALDCAEAVRALKSVPGAAPIAEGEREVLMPVEPSDEVLRSLLAVTLPATFRDHLRHPNNGPKTAADVEKSIEVAKRQYAAIRGALASRPAAREADTEQEKGTRA